METQAYYLTRIKEDLSLKQRQNPHYSLRAYARDMGIHPSTLSLMLKGKRELPVKVSGDVANKLRLGPKERTLFMESIYGSRTSLDDIQVAAEDERFMLDESYFKVNAEWEHYAVLALFDLDGFESSVQEIASRFNISENRADVVLNNLFTCGLLKHEEGKVVKAHAKTRTTEDMLSQSIREGHREALEMGKNKLDEIEVELRDFSTMTIAMDLEKLPEVKTIIREFRQKMAAMLRDGKKTDVCQLAIQFYPLTANKKN